MNLLFINPSSCAKIGACTFGLRLSNQGLSEALLTALCRYLLSLND